MTKTENQPSNQPLSGEVQSGQEPFDQITQQLNTLADQVEALCDARREVLSFAQHVALGETGARLRDCADLLKRVTQDT